MEISRIYEQMKRTEKESKMDRYRDRMMGKISERLKERCIAKLIEIDNTKHSPL